MQAALVRSFAPAVVIGPQRIVRPLTDPASNKPFVLDYNTVYIEPVTAQITGTAVVD